MQHKSSEEEVVSLLSEIFWTLDVSTIKGVFRSLGGSFQSAHGALLILLQEKERKEKENKEKRFGKLKLLQEKFSNMSYGQLQDILSSFDGDVDAACEYIAQVNDKIKFENVDPEVEALNDILLIGNDKVVDLLHQHNGDKKKVINDALKRKSKAFKLAYPNIPEYEVEKIMENNNYEIDAVNNELKKVQNQNGNVNTQNPNNLVSSLIMNEKINEQTLNEKLNQVEKNIEDNPVQNIKQLLRTNGPMFDENFKDLKEIQVKVPHIEASEEMISSNSQMFSLSLPDESTSVNNVGLITNSLNYNPGDKIKLTFIFVGNVNTRDWIGLYHVDSQDKEYITYQWVNDEGSLIFDAPKTVGVYEFRFFLNKSYKKVGVSPRIKVGTEFKINVTPIPGENRRVKIESKLNSDSIKFPNAWIGIYPLGAAKNAYVDYFWRGNFQETTYCLPSAGTWEFKIFPDKSYVHADSFTYNLEGKDKMSLMVQKNNIMRVKYNLVTVDPTKTNVWVGIYNVEEKNYRQFKRYRFIKQHEGEIEFKLMVHPGTYEARLFVGKSDQNVCVSENTITV